MSGSNPISNDGSQPNVSNTIAHLSSLGTTVNSTPVVDTLYPMLNVQSEALKSFVTSQNATLQEMSQSLKSLTNQLKPPATTSEAARSKSADIESILKGIEENDGADEALQDSAEDYGDEVQMLLNEIQTPDDFGCALSNVAATTFQSVHKYHPSKEILEQWKQNYKPPSNCKELVVPAINPEIWTGLPLSAKSADVKLQAVQHHIIRAQVAMARTMDATLSLVGKATLPQILEPMLDSAKSLSLAMQDMNNKRRANLRHLLKPEYAAMCSNRVPVTKFLFGENLDQSLKEVKATSSILRVPGPIQGRYHPYKSPNTRNNLNYTRPPYQMNRGGRYFQNQRGRFQNQRSRRPYHHHRQN